MTEQEEFDLIDQIIAGSQQKYRELVDRYKDYAYTIALRIVNNESDAEEVAQDSFVKAYYALKRFSRKSKFSTWLYRIVFNTAISYKRKRKVHTETIDEIRIVKTVSGGAEDIVKHDEQVKFIKEALSGLLPADATILTLFYLQELSIEEISDVTGLKVNAVKVKLFRARKRMADQMDQILQDELKSLL